MASFVDNEKNDPVDGVSKLKIEGVVDKGSHGRCDDGKKGMKHSGKLDETKLFRMIAGTRVAAREERDKKRTRDGHCFKFWDTQPVIVGPLSQPLCYARIRGRICNSNGCFVFLRQACSQA